MTKRGDITSLKLEEALKRVAEGRGKFINPGRKLSVVAVAEEAGVSPSTIHNRHPEIAKKIRAMLNRPERISNSELMKEIENLRDEVKDLRKAITATEKSG